MSVINELVTALGVEHTQPILKCTAFEDNQIFIDAVKVLSMLPRTNYTSLKCYHFRQYMQQGRIDV